MSKKTLLQQAQELPKHGNYKGHGKTFTPQEVELAVAYATGTIGFRHVATVLKMNPLHPGPVYLFIARAVSQFIRENK